MALWALAAAAVAAEPGVPGGVLRVALRSEPRTLNPVTALDAPSRDVIRLTTADLITIDRETLSTGPALARSWTVSKDGREYVLRLRENVRFSDGHPFDSSDVVFSFQVYQDERVHAAQRELLAVGGKPMQVEARGPHTVVFRLAQSQAAAERLFDSVAILPRHAMEKAWREGTIAGIWKLDTDPASMPVLGPFRVKQYRPGHSVLLERNPHYWRTGPGGARLPYLDGIEFVILPDQEAQALRFEAGETHILDRPTARTFDLLASMPERRLQLRDLGSSLEHDFLFFNLGPAGPDAPGNKLAWFRKREFRQGVSAAIDRAAIVKLVYLGHGTPLWTPVAPGQRTWVNGKLPKAPPSAARAIALLAAGGFRRDAAGRLLSAEGDRVSFSIIVSASNADRMRMATLVQHDLEQTGMDVQVVPLEFRSLLDRVLNTRRYEACLQGLASGDADPTAEMGTWLSSGSAHLWNPSPAGPATAWEAEIDRLMREQMITTEPGRRKKLYDRVQEILSDEMPLISLGSPNVLAGAQAAVGNFRPGILRHYTLWNADELFLRDAGVKARRK